MSVLLVCPKSKGNTFHVCRYVVNHSDAELLLLNPRQADDLKEYTSIFLCSGVYGGSVHRDLLRWLDRIDKTSINDNAKIFAFLTWFGRGHSDKTAMQGVKRRFEEKQLHVESDYMTCFGQGLGIIRHSHPNEEDCERVLNWVKSKTCCSQ